MTQGRVFLVMKIVALCLMVVVMVVLAYHSKLHEKRYVESARVGVPDIGPISARPPFQDFRFHLATAALGHSTAMPAKALSTEDYRGKVLHIIFWASWCEPCKLEFPVLEKLSQKYPDQIQYLLISTDMDAESMAISQKMHADLMPSSLLTFSNLSVSPTDLNVTALPHHIVLDRSGGIAATFIGGIEKEVENLEKLYQGLF